MSSPESTDQSLLNRLNALKPTTISLKQQKYIPHYCPLSKDQPALSREDALAERLRILRNNSQPETLKQASTNKPSASPGGLPTSPSSGISGSAQPQCPATQLPLSGDIQTDPFLAKRLSFSDEQHTPGTGGNRETNNAENPVNNDVDEDDYLQYLESGADPDQTLDELLDGLDDEEFDLDNDNPLSEFDPAKEAKKVSNLLEQFQKENKTPQRAAPAGDNDDDSENDEHMTREVEKILLQVQDELGPASEDKEGERDTDNNDNENKPGPSSDSKPEDAAPSLALPDAPASPLRDIDTTEGESNNNRKSFDFENDIVTRLASLKGLGKGINTDAFGLPVAPTFAPQDHTKKDTDKKIKSTGGYTDEDQKTWCIVCLDDATIKCIGCDNDVFCGRCWRDMHVGPSAGYDERGHQWVKFVR
ncbi:Abscission/NoCut checkpoint regulator [Naviculisporaceae sp. PSN 640]